MLSSIKAQRILTWRAVLIGLAIAVFVNIASPYTESRAFSNFSWSYIPEGGMIPFLVILFIQFLLKKISPRSAFTAGELIIIFVMSLVSNSTCLFLAYFFLAAIVSPHYFASAENQWGTQLIPYIRKWLFVDNPAAAKQFYEGIPKDQPIPWGAWVTPLLNWLPFFFAILLASYVLIVYFRRQWMENEKLSYPIMQVPMALIEGSTSTGGPNIFKDRLFWLGALIPFAFMIMSITHSIIPAFPAIPVDHVGCLFLGQWAPVRGQSLLHFSFLAFGIGYFVPTNVLFSIWLFYIITLIEEFLFNRFWGFGRGYGGMFVWGNSAISWQSFGAFAMLVLVSFYMARRHIWRMLKDGWGGKKDEEEFLSPRFSLIAFIICVVYIVIWLLRSGMPGTVIAIFLPMIFFIYIGLARVICQTGIFYVVPPNIAQNVAIYSLGSNFIKPQGMISLGLSYSWHGDVQTVLPALSAEGAKLWEKMKSPGRQFSTAIILTAVTGLIVAPLFIIWHGYRLGGAINFNTWMWQGWGPNTYKQVLTQIQQPFGPSGKNFTWFAIGAAAMLLLNWLHLRFLWWPIHPIGLAVASSFTIYAVYLGAFFAWLVKSLLLKLGGVKIYRAAAPFFIGIVVGHFVGRGITLFICSWLRIRLI